MLIGKAVYLKDLEKKMKEILEKSKMESKKLNEILLDLNSKFNKMPKIKNEPPTKEMTEIILEIRESTKKLEELQEKMEILKGNIDEAESQKDKDKYVFLSGKDCIFYEIDEKE